MTTVKISVKTSASGSDTTYHTADVEDCPILQQIEWREVALDALAGHYDECAFCEGVVGGGDVDQSYHQSLAEADDWDDLDLAGGGEA